MPVRASVAVLEALLELEPEDERNELEGADEELDEPEDREEPDEPDDAPDDPDDDPEDPDEDPDRGGIGGGVGLSEPPCRWRRACETCGCAEVRLLPPPAENGSWYWLSPAPWVWAWAAAGTASSVLSSRSERRRRRRWDTGRATVDQPPAEPSAALASPDDVEGRQLHILLLADRDWTHPEAGGTGTTLYAQVSRWIAWGHRVTVVAGEYAGAKRHEQLAPGLEVHRMGSRMTVFPRAALAVRRGVGRDADVVLEVINGIAFCTPLWWFLRAPRVALVQHVHQDHYVSEMGRRGRLPALLAERLPLRLLYRSTPVLTISRAARDDLVALGVQPEQIHVSYLGVEPRLFVESRRAATPRLLYLGRLKQYKRIEHTLDALEAVPGAHLDIAGDGDHRPALEAEVRRRGLDERVTFHGYVDEQRKDELYGRAWVSLTASSAEGWCHTVLEAAAHATPTVALAVGGLRESIVDGRTGLLADTPEELAVRARELVADPDRREQLGRNARERARTFSWERSARESLELLELTATRPARTLRERARASETAKATALAGATLVANAIQLLFTVVFTRLLHASGYGSLAAIMSAFLVLLVGGQAIQVAAARETALGRLGSHERLRATVDAWSRRLVAAAVVAAVVGWTARVPLAHLVGVPDHALAAGALLPTGVLWLLLSLQRGVLQGLHAYRPVGWSLVVEPIGRLAGGLALVLAGAGVTGAFLGTPVAMVLTAAALALVLRRRLGTARSPRPARTLRSLLAGAWAPIGGLALLALLQNVDVIVVKHAVGGTRAGSYAAAAVAAKAVVWIAIGIALHLLPEATRRAAAGLDPLPVLRRALGVLVVIASPALLIFALAPKLLLRLAFGAGLTSASSALVVLGLAMTLLACAYLTVQYMLALGRTSFLWVLGAVAIVEPFLLSAGAFSLFGYAAVVLGVQVVAASAVLALGLRRSRTVVPAPA